MSTLTEAADALRAMTATEAVEQRVVMFSGGVGSWAAAKRVAERHGTAGMTLLFMDTRMEDEDLYRFLDEAAANVGAPLVRIAEGRTPWQVFFDERFLGNSRVDPCSRILKRQMADRWLAANRDKADTTVYVGIDWTEEHRYTALRDRRAANGWRYEAPLCEAPYLDKRDVMAWLKREGIAPPRLYAMGFAHNNCGGFCVKAGQGHFATLLRELPERYAEHEANEERIRAYLGKDVSMLTDRRGDGIKKPLTLRALRERIQSGAQIDAFEIGGCGCFVEDALDTASTGRQRRMENAPEYTCVCGWRGTKPSFSDATRTRLNRELGMVEIVREHVAVCPLCFAEVERAP